jgi:5-carboxymethyl-2-hydroxymuconate isomerase
MADVFGGMGSWNDIDPGEDAETYQRLSAELFEVMKRYFAALLSR